jgi:stage V sporulation protein G
VRGMKIIQGTTGLFVSMPSRKRPDGSHQDIAHPVTADLRRRIEEQVLEAFRKELERSGQTF